MAIRAGDLDRRITVLGEQVTQIESGEEVITWVEVGTVWAQKIELMGAERFADRQLIGSSLCTFRFRWSERMKAVTTEHVVDFDGRRHDIIDVREVGRREGIEIDCTVPSEQPLAP